MEWFSTVHLSTQQYNASNLSMDSRIPSLSRKCIHPHNKQWFKTVHEILRTLTSNTGFHTTSGLRPRRHPYSFRERYRESIVFPLSPPPWISFSSSPAQPCPLDYKHASNLSMDLLRHFKTQWIPLRNKETVPGRSFEKSILKQAHFRITVPRFDITGQPFEPSCHGPIHYSTKLCFNVSLDNRGPFQDNNDVLNPWTQWNGFPTVHVSYSTIRLQPVHGQQDTFSEQNTSIHNKTVV
ncbi:hypothetical protein TNCT_404311 [Trichonephila clavata]|uniref:Uncharacterized protein n=1 Tax=Trichonephila clavata TaxID=2740835 RepID=A0A8X6J5D0_TRICU|nr:hypothetical protein TNCT_404311 [Trichonephila clavata]